LSKRQAGFTLMELIVVVGVLGILAAMATPPFLEWTRNARYREAARDIASALRDARTTAITRNFECQVEFDLAGRRYRTTRGNRAAGSDAFDTVLRDWYPLPNTILLRRNDACDGNANLNFEFNPNGTRELREGEADTWYSICVMDTNPVPVQRFRVRVPAGSTGRVLID
jgi:prepilin-type N-terminal cleavage/methylation domain-containing protein